MDLPSNGSDRNGDEDDVFVDDNDNDDGCNDNEGADLDEPATFCAGKRDSCCSSDVWGVEGGQGVVGLFTLSSPVYKTLKGLITLFSSKLNSDMVSFTKSIASLTPIIVCVVER